jgi:serine/threonine-protein phosphatase 5
MQARKLFLTLPSLVDVPISSDAHLTVCGDVHGQYYDLLNIFSLNGNPSPDNPYLFNGEKAGESGGAHNSGGVHNILWFP